MSLEQQRARFAWDQVQQHRSDDFKKSAKGAPALIMSNGLMASLAYWRARKSKQDSDKLLISILLWLGRRYPECGNTFDSVMSHLQGCNSIRFMQITSESLEFLKWLRHFAAAVS